MFIANNSISKTDKRIKCFLYDFRSILFSDNFLLLRPVI
jgi:hypothetical protein